MFGMLAISTVVVIPEPCTDKGFRVKRVTLANIHCAYIERESVFNDFKRNNARLPDCDMRAEFKFSEFL